MIDGSSARIPEYIGTTAESSAKLKASVSLFGSKKIRSSKCGIKFQSAVCARAKRAERMMRTVVLRKLATAPHRRHCLSRRACCRESRSVEYFRYPRYPHRCSSSQPVFQSALPPGWEFGAQTPNDCQQMTTQLTHLGAVSRSYLALGRRDLSILLLSVSHSSTNAGSLAPRPLVMRTILGNRRVHTATPLAPSAPPTESRDNCFSRSHPAKPAQLLSLLVAQRSGSCFYLLQYRAESYLPVDMV